MNKVNPKAGALRQKKCAILNQTGDIPARMIAFMFSIVLFTAQPGAAWAADSDGVNKGGWYNESTGDSTDPCCELERKGPGKPRVRPIHIPQPTEKAFRLADNEVTRNMNLSLREKPDFISSPDFEASDLEIDGLFLRDTRVQPLDYKDADDKIDSDFRAENIQMPAMGIFLQLDSLMDARFRSENGF